MEKNSYIIIREAGIYGDRLYLIKGVFNDYDKALNKMLNFIIDEKIRNNNHEINNDVNNVDWSEEEESFTTNEEDHQNNIYKAGFTLESYYLQLWKTNGNFIQTHYINRLSYYLSKQKNEIETLDNIKNKLAVNIIPSSIRELVERTNRHSP